MTNSRFAVQKNRSPYIPPLPQNVRPCRSHWSWCVIRIVCLTQNSNLEGHQVHLCLICTKFLKILASILLLTEFYLNFVKASYLLYQSCAQIWTFFPCLIFFFSYFNLWVVLIHCLSFHRFFLFTNMSSMASTLALWFSTFQWSEIYKFTLILIQRSHENRHAPK